ncbi:Uncharacterized protein PCOAH_00046080 [Plasmodium coatneyi]|uniref:Uncharacterized protein n=1 Tax=Plasmodium coatneyi TaxID=208452 RepID=A0A1B1E5G5_9APIC|nr:Uncharacterized protein PCOAH_00046080 [Plasmodium coatneyi]ANQ10263.1 Uncharacterized protein PCOAH_00046080 [Plasmodium coatneyi]
MPLKNDAKNKNVKTNVNNSVVQNRSSGPTNHATVVDSNPSGNRSRAEELREERRDRRSRNAQRSDIASCYIDDVGNAKKGKGDKEVIINEVQVSTTSLREDTLKRTTQDYTTVRVNDIVRGTRILDDDEDVQLIEEFSTFQTRNGKGEQHSIIPPQGEDSRIPKREKSYPMKDPNREKEHDNSVVQEEVEIVTVKRSKRKPIRNNKYDIFIQEESTRNVDRYSNMEGPNNKKKKVLMQKNIVDNTFQPNYCEVKTSSIITREEDNLATNVNVTYSRIVDSLRGNTDHPVHIKSVPSLTKNEKVPQKPEHYYCNVLGNDVLTDAAENAPHNLSIPRVGNSTTDDNAYRFSAPTSAVNGIDARGYDLSSVNQNMWNDPDRKGEQSAEEMVPEGRAVDMHSSVRGFQRGRSHRGRGKGKSGLGRGRGRGNFRGKKIEYIKQQPYSINPNDLMSDAERIFPHITDQGGMTVLPISEDAHQSVVAPPVEKKKRGRKKKIQNSNAQDSVLDVSLNENAREDKSSVSPLLHYRRTRRRCSDVLFDMGNAPGDADKINSHIPRRASSMFQGRDLPHLRTLKDDINSSGAYRSWTSARRRVKDERDKEYLYGGNSTLGVGTLDGTNSGNVVSRSSGSHHPDYACGRSGRRRNCTERGKHITGRKKSRGRGCTSANITTNVDSDKSSTSNVLLKSEWNKADNNKKSNNHRCSDSDSKRLFPNETFQIKEEFMNSVNSLNTVFNFNDEFLKFLKKISQVDDIDYDVMLLFLGEVQDKLAKDIKQEFPRDVLHSHNVDESVEAMGYLVDILNNNNEILNKLNQLEYKFYYDYVRKRSCKEANKQKNYDHKVENEIAQNSARIPTDINNECCSKIESNDLGDDNRVNNHSSKSLNQIDDEEKRKLNELMHCADKEMNDNCKTPTCGDMSFMNYKEGNDFHHINEGNLNLKNDCASITLPNCNSVGDKPHNERGGTVGERGVPSHPTSGVAPQVTKCTRKDRQHVEEKEKQEGEANAKTNKFVKDATGEGPPQVAPKCTDKTDHNAEKEKMSKKISRKINDIHFKRAHKLIKRNNFDFVCDELNKLIKQTLQNEDLFYSNYSDGRYRNVNEESLFKHYISTKLYETSNLVDTYNEEQKESNLPTQRAFRGRKLGDNKGISRKVDEREKTLMQSYADYFRRLNDVSSRERIGESGKSGPAQLGHSTNDQLDAHSNSTGVMLSHADDNTEKKEQNNRLNSEEQMHDGQKGTDPQSGSIQKEEAQKDEHGKKKFWFAKIIPFFKKNANANGSVDNNNPDDVDGAVKKETNAKFETHPSGSVEATGKGLGDGKSKIDGEKANASIKTHDEGTKVSALFKGNRNSLDISNRSEKDMGGKSATDLSLRHYGSGITEYGTLPKTCAHAFSHTNETSEKNIDTLLKETFHLKDNEFMSIKGDRTQQEILNCLRMVSQIKKIFFDECSKMINDQIYVLEKNFRIPGCSLSILKDSFGYNDGE